MYFEWSTKKAARNLAKHGVSFYEATEVFGDDLSSTVPDPDHSEGENRTLIFGQSRRGRYLVVSFSERPDAIRLVSARPMTGHERRAYEQ